MALFQAYLVQGTAWRSVTLQGVRQNRRLPPRMGTEFGCKICILCADSTHRLTTLEAQLVFLNFVVAVLRVFPLLPRVRR